jgi:Serine hydrolase (FSH1)
MSQIPLSPSMNERQQDSDNDANDAPSSTPSSMPSESASPSDSASASPPPFDSDAIPTPFRVLCLHGEGSNAGELCQKLNDLGRRLYDNHAIELVFINSPLVSVVAQNDRCDEGRVHDGDDGDDTVCTTHNANARVWWEEKTVTASATTNMASRYDETNEEDEDDAREEQSSTSDGQVPKQYVGLDASLLLLRQICTSQPFWGILAVGQGASVAALLALLPDMKHRPSFSIFVEGTTVLDDEEELLLNENESVMPCLHILGVDPSDSAQRLVRQFGGEVSSGIQPFSNVSLNRIGKV